MAGRPRKNRETIKGSHLSIRLTEKEVATLDAMVAVANTEREQQHVAAVGRWEQLPTVTRLKRSKPEPPKPATYADIVRSLLQWEARIPRIHEKGFWSDIKDTEPLDHLVDLANDREQPAYRWTRETMLRKLIEEEWGRRRLTQVERRRYRRNRFTEKQKEEEWREQAKDTVPSETMPEVLCPHCTKTFALPPR